MEPEYEKLLTEAREKKAAGYLWMQAPVDVVIAALERIATLERIAGEPCWDCDTPCVHDIARAALLASRGGAR